MCTQKDPQSVSSQALSSVYVYNWAGQRDQPEAIHTPNDGLQTVRPFTGGAPALHPEFPEGGAFSTGFPHPPTLRSLGVPWAHEKVTGPFAPTHLATICP